MENLGTDRFTSIGEMVMLNVHIKNLGSVAILSVQGHVVIGQTEILRNAVQSLPETNGLILDLQSVNIIDAHGLGVLLELRERSLARGMCFELMNVSKPLREILRITRLNTVFQINPGIEFFPWALFARRPRVVAA